MFESFNYCFLFLLYEVYVGLVMYIECYRFQSIVKFVSVNDGVDQMGVEFDIMEFVEQMGGYFEFRSLIWLVG